MANCNEPAQRNAPEFSRRSAKVANQSTTRGEAGGRRLFENEVAEINRQAVAILYGALEVRAEAGVRVSREEAGPAQSAALQRARAPRDRGDFLGTGQARRRDSSFEKKAEWTAAQVNARASSVA